MKQFLSYGDWCGLTALLFTEIFSLNFITPSYDDDLNTYRLQTLLDLSVYEELIQKFSVGEVNKNAPDLIDAIYSPSANIRFETPHLNTSAFNPRSKYLEFEETENFENIRL